MDLKDKKVTVVGMARSGIAAANFLALKGASVTIIDQRDKESVGKSVITIRGAVKKEFEASAPEEDADLIILSPGVEIDSPSLAAAKDSGIEIISELEFASRFNDTPVVAVTGTNGKSTTTVLVGTLIQNAEKRVLIGGNIGIPFISLVNIKPMDYLVIEVSSFQLEAISEFRPEISVILNITPDHIDRHKTFEHYAKLKAKIADNQTENDFIVLNQDDSTVLEIAKDLKPHKVYFSAKQKVDEGAYLEGGKIFICRNNTEEEICPITDLKQSIQWQTENVLASVATASVLDIDAKIIAETIKGFTGLEHRMEWLSSIKGVDFINDSKGTNIGSLQKALSCVDKPVVLIVGGKDKDSDFTSLKELFNSKVKHAVLIGETKNKIKSDLNGFSNFSEAGSLKDAVDMAYAKATSGDVVLLGPGCSSFDMFKNFEDRGNQFKSFVSFLKT